MNTFLGILILLLSFVLLLLAWWALSSCLGDDIRAAISGRSGNRSSQMRTYGLDYARSLGHGNHQGGWEQIEMEDMMDKGWQDEDYEESDKS
ncbi:hypothetical protein K431DRAFT_68610 [Polychaeton citri CBS 116435]|uniref:Uncharacterized protein n=1 Tax=Polychaeton citri CBS 116435 TaxID=1314669 RepID=A0A9P4QAU2_9PEZI|nr:hypothetical protein K431DRAFT_68610 [Polychaeton citri CBS 116435]